ncbi:rhomboid family intramembrane serine protease [candidate division KSB1 bacterium]
MYQEYQRYEIGMNRAITPVVKLLIIANAAVFICQILFAEIFHISLSPYLGLVPKYVYTRFTLWQIFTYLFLHGGFFHILINMFVLWMFGCELERYFGSKEFLFYYFATGVGAGIFSIIFDYNSIIPIIGASGAIYGILTAFGMIFPNRLIYLYFFIPIRAKYFVIIFGIITLLSAISASHTGIAHLAHLGGMIIGFIYIKKNFRFEQLFEAWRHYKFNLRLKNIRKRQKKVRNFKERINIILDKINEVGYENLTEEEKEILQKASNFFTREDEKNN